MGNRQVYLTRVYSFSASHRLRSPELSEEENRKVYGKCSHPSGHGHNYILRVTIKGSADPVTGMLANIEDIDSIVEKRVIEPMDHRDLNHVIDSKKVITSENLIKEIWNRLAQELSSAGLYKIALEETRKNSFEYFGI